MDLDTTQRKNAFEKIVSKLEKRKTDILIGTQMVTKGLDFDNVSVVGILNADNLINFPDFRAHERAYQLISQVSGRAGRKHERGKVVLQTSQPDHPLIKLIQEQNFVTFMQNQLNERELFKYPPYYRLIKLVVKHKKVETVNRVANQLASELKNINGLIVLGPEFPLVSRIQLWHHKEIWVKVNKKTKLDWLKESIEKTIAKIKQQTSNSNSIVLIDVDPY
jgi:primosomal protein N' (replication factor Y)